MREILCRLFAFIMVKAKFSLDAQIETKIRP